MQSRRPPVIATTRQPNLALSLLAIGPTTRRSATDTQSKLANTVDIVHYLATFGGDTVFISVFSERTHVHVRYMLSPVRLSSVCLSSVVCNVRAP